MTAFVPLDTIDPAAVDALLDHAFGTDRHARTAYAIRGAGQMLPALSFAGIEDGVLVGSIQCWPIILRTDTGDVLPMAMVGPVAVEPGRQGDGIGRHLMALALAAADATGDSRALMLIGDPDYYGRFFGFTADRTALWRAPGPVERHRLLARGDGVPDAAGILGPAQS